MHLLFLTDNFPPESNAPASRTFEHCCEWVRLGVQVTVITCAPNFPHGKVFGGYKNRLKSDETIEGIRVIRVWSFMSPNVGFYRRILDHFSFLPSAVFAGVFVRDVDLIVGTSPQFFTICAAYILGKLKKTKWVLELRDLWPDSLRAISITENSYIFGVLHFIENHLYEKANLIICVTHGFRNILISRGIDANKIRVITNGVSLESFIKADKKKRLTEKLMLLERDIVVGYIGTIGLAHSLEVILEAAEWIENNRPGGRYKFLIVGEGAEKSRLKKRAFERNISTVTFVDGIPKDEIADYWDLIDVCIIHLKKSNVFETVLPSKIFEAMASGTPVIAGVKGECAQLIERYEIGLNFEAENAGDLINKLDQLANDSLEIKRLSEMCRLAAQKYDRRILARAMLDQLKEI